MDNNYQLSRIHNYINGLMSGEEMHSLEREALDDPFLQDAIEGYALQNGVDAKKLSLLQKRLTTRVAQSGINRDTRFYGWQRLAIGATAAVMFVTACILLLIKYIPQQQKADLSEVEILQEAGIYNIHLEYAGSLAQPVDGWASYSAYIDQHWSNAEALQGRIQLNFDINEQGKPINIECHTDNGALHRFREIEDLLANGPKWTGTKGSIVLDIKKTK